MENIWFTGDTHFGHKSILEYAGRPFKSVEEMDEALIDNWNSVVSPQDAVYHLGDAGLCTPAKLERIVERLHGKIHLIRGNHERSAEACKEFFEWIKDYHELRIEDAEAHKGRQLIVLFHYPLRVWKASHYGSYHLYGHSHGMLPDDPTSYSSDIGVDCHNYRPVSYHEVKAIMKRKIWKPRAMRER